MQVMYQLNNSKEKVLYSNDYVNGCGPNTDSIQCADPYDNFNRYRSSPLHRFKVCLLSERVGEGRKLVWL
jgi:hypothetical protein